MLLMEVLISIKQDYKAIFVARGFSQKEGIDYKETFAPVARYTSIMTIIYLATNMKWKLHQMDVKTTFLNSVIEEEVYIEQPQGFEVEDRKSHVCRLKKAEESLIRIEASSQSLVWPYRQFLDELWIYQE